MPTLLEQCQTVFQTDNLYTVLGVDQTASPEDVKKAYYRRSMVWHPDKAEDKKSATERFQVLGKIYSILSDPERRKVYDDTGSVDDDWTSQDKDWAEYWRLLFPKVTVQDIQDFEEKYKGSEEEREDVKTAYLQSEGDMEHILSTVLCCTFEDEKRFSEMLAGMIQEGDVPDFDKFSKENKKKKKERTKKAKREAQEAEELSKKLKVTDQSSLMAAISQRQASRANQAEDFFAQLEAKYGGKAGGGSGGSKKKSKR